ncbi:MAG: ABC transporter permease subunit [Candidatus Omnitrophica bacterium]|nr:ABC transporter permease subunit [Candidatus Omnitrophota bacterium]
MITRPTITQTPSVLIDGAVALVLCAVIFGLVLMAREWQAPLQSAVVINLSPWALPGYAALSFLRGIAAYGLSLLFTLIYGYTAAHAPRAERIMIPILDILQSIPVLGFLPGAVVAFMAVFPDTNMGLELVSILMIFSGQVWNMTFSFYYSLKNIPSDLREAAAVYHFNWWQRFCRLELPASIVGLSWNSMMSMAGGWFFLMICEAFTLGEHSFRLPGLGSYMSVAIAEHNVPAIIAGSCAMMGIIACVDFLIWRPVLVWAQKFRLEDTASAAHEDSRLLRWMRRSWLLRQLRARVTHPISEQLSTPTPPAPLPAPSPMAAPRPFRLPSAVRVASVLFGLACASVVVVGGIRFAQLLLALPLAAWQEIFSGALLTWLRVMGAVALGSLWTVPVGIWIGQSDRRRKRLQPLVQMAASFPAPMLYPLVVILLHRAGWEMELTAVILMLLGTQWYLLFNIIAGASTVPEDLREAAAAYHFTPKQRWWIVWWPAVFPYLITGWVTAAGGAWNASIVAEYVSAERRLHVAHGLGSMISISAGAGQPVVLAAGVVTMVVIVVVMNRLCWRPLQRFAQVRYAA